MGVLRGGVCLFVYAVMGESPLLYSPVNWGGQCTSKQVKTRTNLLNASGQSQGMKKKPPLIQQCKKKSDLVFKLTLLIPSIMSTEIKIDAH